MVGHRAFVAKLEDSGGIVKVGSGNENRYPTQSLCAGWDTSLSQISHVRQRRNTTRALSYWRRPVSSLLIQTWMPDQVRHDRSVALVHASAPLWVTSAAREARKSGLPPVTKTYQFDAQYACTSVYKRTSPMATMPHELRKVLPPTTYSHRLALGLFFKGGSVFGPAFVGRSADRPTLRDDS